MSVTSEERVTVSYEVVQLVADPSEKPKCLKIRKDCKIMPTTAAHIRIRTPYDDPFVIVSVQSNDMTARAIIRDITKGMIEVIVIGTIKASAVLHVLAMEGQPDCV